MSITDIGNILHLLERPLEPVFMPKGRNDVCFDIQADYLPSKFHPFEREICQRYSTDSISKIPIVDIPMPDVKVAEQVGRDEFFSLFAQKHIRSACSLIDVLMDAKSTDELLAIAASCRDKLNPQLFFYALSVAILHREDTKHLPIPPIHEVFPGHFFENSAFIQLKEQAFIVPDGLRNCIEIPKDYTASDLEPEHRLAYFREDIGVNSHHWHWHLTYPIRGNMTVVDKDRRGELFYYMHQQMMARYNCERLCAQLGRTKAFNNFRDVAAEGYFPKLNCLVAGKSWASRPSGLVFKDIDRPVENLLTKIEELERWRERIYSAIHKREIVTEAGEIVSLTGKNGIDVLGNIVESTILSPNSEFYGDLHNAGHNIISCCHDPDYRHLEPVGVMWDVTTAMRDPIFYRWHTFINDIFIAHKHTLPAYTIDQLSFPDIAVRECRIITPEAPANTLKTFWSKAVLELSKGIDFAPKGDILVRVTHLNQDSFVYKIEAANSSDETRTGTVRIFLGPALDERNLPFALQAQMNLMIEMDKFTVTLQPGDNTIQRSSENSSVTLKTEQLFRSLKNNSAAGTDGNSAAKCGCGWPQHMLVPKGTAAGYSMRLFVMITNHDEDFIPQPAPSGGTDASSFCGIRDRKYPDARPMGFPFDRKPRDQLKELSAFLTPNMAVAEIKVQFTDAVKEKKYSDRSTPKSDNENDISSNFLNVISIR